MPLAYKHLKTGAVGKLEFDAMTATSGTGLRRSYEIHLTNARKKVRQCSALLQQRLLRQIDLLGAKRNEMQKECQVWMCVDVVENLDFRGSNFPPQ